MNEPRKQGYVEDFNLAQQCRNGQYKLFADDFKVEKLYWVEGPSDSSAILYALSSERYGQKGLLVNDYGISGEAVINEMLRHLTVR